jgi:hypothetical protein
MGESRSRGQTKNRWLSPPTRTNGLQTESKHMKTLRLIALAALALTTAFAAQAGTVRGYTRSNGTYVAPHYRASSGSLSSGSSSGYVYRNPYAATPSVVVGSYTKTTGTVVAPHVRTPANTTPSDNLNYRGFGTVRMPKH